MDQDVFGAPTPNPLANLTEPALDSNLSQFNGGSAAIASFSALSALMVLFLLIQLIVITLFPMGRKLVTDMQPIRVERAFLRTHLGMYVFCLLITNLSSAVGGIIQAVWAIRMTMSQDLGASGSMSVLVWEFATCQAQSWLFQIGDVGAAVWGTVMAVHAFRTLVLHRILTTKALVLVLALGWFFILFFAFAGPVIVQRNSGISFYGPVFSDNGPLWCWIYYPYAQFQFWFHYLFLILAALSSAVLYIMVFVILRYRQRKQLENTGSDPIAWRYEAWLQIVVKRMLAYPLAYVVMIMPITLCRLVALSGFPVSSLAFFISSSIFSLTGFVNGLILIWGSKVWQTAQWRTLIDYWCRRTSESHDIEQSPRMDGQGGAVLSKKEGKRASVSPGSHPFCLDPAPRRNKRPSLPPLITVQMPTPVPPNHDADELSQQQDSAGSTASKYSFESRKRKSTFFAEAFEVPLPLPVRPLVTRKPVPPVVPKRSSLRNRNRIPRFSVTFTHHAQTMEEPSPISAIDEPSTSILERFPIPPLLQRLAEVGPSMAGLKRGSKSAPTSPKLPVRPVGPRPYPTLPAHPGVYITPPPYNEPDKAPTQPTVQTPTDIILSVLRSDDEQDSDGGDSEGSLTPPSAKAASIFSSTTVTPSNYRKRKSRRSTRRLTVTASNNEGGVTSSADGVAS
ncbi:hypothetical protein DACRYDRAFT_114074 [Dacryopinax primogenitus]|uniref:G-protein coupled receptors family 2 profile 2 domain-containing protein n=1 Tax=Dacryopinax primogenitus (strain DJM 731) TaxID=1858805 RepID=M5GG22_DACPD|nr:uncharacterized protein DACRYDRAFT_114074 [Dacryopinax primogenitus]EJU04733.1 hypothetical protein DACRYDRAFT_114074 [Dacryopinax primogenitus]